MKNIFIFHGSYGYPEENWFPWLKKELSKLGHKIYVPKFPIPKTVSEEHELKKWLETFEDYKSYLDENSIIIAHSRGCSFAFQLLPTLGIKINGLFLVGPFIDYDQWRPNVYSKYDSFQAKPYLWKRIRQLVKYTEVFQSTNDVIPVSEGQFIADWLHAKMNVVKNAGHFNTSYHKKFTKFPLLLSSIKKFIQDNS
ncbi:MAG: alpha/beta hydrolase [Patescibacteria group bacterium]|jgi:hypothetical protein